MAPPSHPSPEIVQPCSVMPRYVFEKGLRKVLPYYVNYQTHAKQRWVGRTLVETYVNDFGEPLDGVINDIHQGKLRVVTNVGTSLPSNAITDPETLLQRKVDSKDVVYHLKHKHEPSIPWQEEVPIVFEDDEIIVVNKPSGVPTHPSGNYMRNSLSEIVKEMYKFDSIWTCHRLDKVTSGVLILCKTRDSAIKFSNLLQDKKNKVKKIYLARVKGEFPSRELSYKCPIFAVNMNGYLQPGDLENLQADTTTMFQRLSYNRKLNESIVQCQPISGKFHQIRIHLRNLGYPISNDQFYDPDEASGTYFAKSKLELSLYERLFRAYPVFREAAALGRQQTGPNSLDLLKVIQSSTDLNIQKQLRDLKRAHSDNLMSRKSAVCTECKRPLFDEDHVANSSIYLHALRFEYDKHIFETDFPSWATID
ncbi:hypothetical protein KGF57_002893 [Candida theae]|uniref:Pseudouridine synthase RsuA/RluA-like domain-containing protein n=1 Tax=Candida theae TaxID=1198502 RepID=A0AAD5BED6_9ASCO|nr:uncharacterized protein KGF57_002893 [Candida theae]KAI5958085.1 hypothetical protein KGF57_002893 [Candida theae]